MDSRHQGFPSRRAYLQIRHGDSHLIASHSTADEERKWVALWLTRRKLTLTGVKRSRILGVVRLDLLIPRLRIDRAVDGSLIGG